MFGGWNVSLWILHKQSATSWYLSNIVINLNFFMRQQAIQCKWLMILAALVYVIWFYLITQITCFCFYLSILYIELVEPERELGLKCLEEINRQK